MNVLGKSEKAIHDEGLLGVRQFIREKAK